MVFHYLYILFEIRVSLEFYTPASYFEILLVNRRVFYFQAQKRVLSITLSSQNPFYLLKKVLVLQPNQFKMIDGLVAQLDRATAF